MGRIKKHLNEVVNVCWNYAGRLETDKDHVMNAITGLMGESGEVSDQIKKWYFHAPNYDYAEFRRRLVLEIGDVIFYTLKLMDLFGITLKEVLDGNREKLASRHPEMGQVTERFGPEAIR